MTPLSTLPQSELPALGPLLRVEDLSKSFTLHNQGGVRVPVWQGVTFEVSSAECVILLGASGVGKSTLLRAIYANYLVGNGHIWIRHGAGWVDMARAAPREVLQVRRDSLGYVSQFLRVIPRVPALDIVSEPMMRRGMEPAEARERAAALLERLHVPMHLWRLPPATFSGGEQQRINIARGFAVDYPLMLLDEPTAALDEANRHRVVDLIREARARGSAVLGIFHDPAVRAAVASRHLDLTPFRSA